MNKRQMKSAVAKAARIMDKEYGRSWVRVVNIDNLDMRSIYNCILGQVENSHLWFTAWCNKLCETGDYITHSWSDAHQRFHKYDLTAGVFSSPEYKEYWVKEIEKRRKRYA